MPLKQASQWLVMTVLHSRQSSICIQYSGSICWQCELITIVSMQVLPNSSTCTRHGSLAGIACPADKAACVICTCSLVP